MFVYARSPMTDAEFRALLGGTLSCRVDARERCADAMERFLARCHYQQVSGCCVFRGGLCVGLRGA